MNKLSSLIVTLFVPFSLALTGCGAGPHSNCAMPASQQAIRSVTVVGQGEATGKPDIARTSLGVEASASTVQDAMDQTTTKMNAIIEALKKMGVAEKDIKTANFSISMERPYLDPTLPGPVMEPMPGPATPISPKAGVKVPGAATIAPPPPVRAVPAVIYRANNTVEVVVRDVSKASRVLQAAVEAGANNVWNVSFGIDDTKALEADARAKAIADARARAEALAKLEGLTLGSVISVSEVIGRGPISPMPMFASAEAKFGGGPSLSPGEVSMGMSIEVVFALQK